MNEPAIAVHPFDNAEGDSDIILHTTDNVHFYVHKVMLSFASPVFRGMFSIGQPPTLSKDLPIIDFPSESQTVNLLLRIIYPTKERAIGSLKVVSTVLDAAVAYEMEKAISHLKPVLLSFVQVDPLAVYAAACRFDMNKEAEVAALRWRTTFKSKQKESPTDRRVAAISEFKMTPAGASFIKDMENITASNFFRLLRYIGTGDEDIFREPLSYFGIPPGDVGCEVSESLWTWSPFNRYDADVILRSFDGVDIRVHKLVLSVASADGILETCVQEAVDPLDDIPIYRAEESREVLAWLLRLCYPFGESDVKSSKLSIAQTASIRSAGEKYSIPKVIKFAKEMMTRDAKTYPLQVYFVARQYGWTDEATEAVGECADHCETLDSVDSYTKEMEKASAKVYFELLQDHHIMRNLKPKGRKSI